MQLLKISYSETSILDYPFSGITKYIYLPLVLELTPQKVTEFQTTTKFTSH